VPSRGGPAREPPAQSRVLLQRPQRRPQRRLQLIGLVGEQALGRVRVADPAVRWQSGGAT
jgi:hypothetical protein